MTQIDQALTEGLELDEMDKPQSAQATQSMEQKRKLKRRLDDYFEQLALRKAMGLDD